MPVRMIFPTIVTILLTGTPVSAEDIAIDDKLTATARAPFDNFGHALALAGDTLVVGTPYAEVDGKLWAGAAMVFERDLVSGDWMERGRLVASDGAQYDELGMAVEALCSDRVRDDGS